MRIIFPDSQKCACSEKIERPRLKDLIQIHLNLIQMIWIGSEGWEGPKMFGFFGGASENDEIIIGKVREPKLEEEKAKGFNMQVGYG